MNTKFTIKNFRVFDENGATIDLKPLTILTGCNSSGKSTIARAAILLNSFLSQVKRNLDNGDSINLSDYKIDFTTYPNNLFGTFDNVIHEGSSSHEITLGYSVYSRMLSKDVDVQLVFSKIENDELKNAYLKSITMSTEGQVFFSSSNNKVEGTKFNLEILKDTCVDFLPIEYAIDQYCALESEYKFGHSVSKEEYIGNRKKFLFFLGDCEENRKKDVLRYARTTRAKDAIVSRCKADLNVLTWTMENNSLFMIPVVEWLNSLKKEETEYAVNKLINSESDAMIAATQRVLQDYMVSDCKTFGEFFRQYEQLYLTDVDISFFAKKKAPNLIDADDLKINQDYVFMDTFNASAEYVDLEGNRSKPKASKEKLIEDHQNTPLSFPIVYEIVMAWNSKYAQEDSVYYNDYTTEMGGVYHSHMMYLLLTHFAADLLREVICPDWCGNITYVRSDRAIVKRLYSLESEDDFTKLLKKYLDGRRMFLEKDQYSSWSQRRVYDVDHFINRWIDKLGIGKSLEVRVEAEGWGVSIRNHKEEGDNGRLLADEGHGITQLASILLQIEMAIQSAQGEKVNRNYALDNLDGYEQEFHYEINTIVIEEPEIHLHPRYQSKLAKMFVEASQQYNIHFIIETHSEYLIRKLQLLVAGKDEKLLLGTDNLSIVYVYSLEESQKEGVPQVKDIKVCKDGYLDDTFGPGFFDEATSLSRQLL